MKYLKILPVLSLIIPFSTMANDYYIQLNKEIVNKVQIKKDDITIPEETTPDWIAVGLDSCDGMRQSSFNPNVYYARANFSGEYKGDLKIPSGFHWASTSEYMSLASVSNAANVHTYFNTCGIRYAEINGRSQYGFAYSDSMTTNRYSISNDFEKNSVYNTNNTNVTYYFAGYVLIKD